MYKPSIILCKNVFLAALCVVFVACTPQLHKEPIPPLQPDIAPLWEPLYTRLQNDTVNTPDLGELFEFLGNTPSQAPMGRKITVLYKNKYKKEFKKAPAKTIVPTKKGAKKKSAKKKPYRIPLYRGVVTNANAELCIAFIKKYQATFDATEKKTHVPPTIAAALLFVETRLGTILGTESAFLTLASMAASRYPSYIETYLKPLPNVDKHSAWLKSTMQKRSDWAYKELKALLAFSAENKLDLRTMPGSMYGAIGICQFMPSNLNTYTADGNNDGIIDLFTPEDAIASLAQYLKKNGWKKGMSRKNQHKVIRRYNRINIYPNTVLALSDRIKKLQKAQKRVKS